MPDRRYLNPDVLARISSLEFRARQVVEGFVSGMHRSPYQGYSVEFAQHREYVAGDDLRHIDWRVFGKSDRFYIKQYEEETNLRAHLLLDCSSSMRYPEHDPKSGRMTKFEYAATLAASLAYLLIHQQDAVGLTLFDDAVRAELPTLSNQGHLRDIIQRIEAARLERPTRAKDLFHQFAAHYRPRTVVIVISDLLANVDEITAGLERLRYGRHEVVVMHVLDHDEREFPFMDNTQFEGLEQPELQLLADPQSLRKGYLAALNEFIEKIKTSCTNHKIDYLGLSTKDPLDVALRGYLAARTHFSKARA